MNLKRIFQSVCPAWGHSRDALNDPVTTDDGRKVIPPRSYVTFDGRTINNISAVVGQKRRIELTRQLQQISFRDDKPLLDRRTGTFYRQSDVTAHGITAATPLGRIDVAVEEGIFKVAVDIAKFGQLFHGAGHANPIVLDDGTGRVYPANNPSETCGYLKPGPTVDSPGL